MDTTKLKELIKNFLATNEIPITELKELSEKTATACYDIGRAWSGSPLGHHAYYYYGDFTPPPADSLWSIEWGTVNGVPRGWKYYQGNEVKEAIEEAVGNGFSIGDYSRKYEQLFSAIEALKNDVLIELSDFEFDDRTQKEKELYDSIESYNLGEIDQLRADYINGSGVIGQYISRDMKALSAGKIIPSHVTTMAGVRAAEGILENIHKFIALVDRFIKQMDKKVGVVVKKENTRSMDAETRLENMLNNFHGVAKQLKARHASRSTLEITDEYDVQDLLHAILGIDFDDVRPEEWTPSYAGSSARMDFLLKKEEIVVEVKITSERLKERELGEQLILDIAHYKQHQNCKKLYCFVYDPKSLIKKHSSLVNDLQRKHDELDVKLFIRPSN